MVNKNIVIMVDVKKRDFPAYLILKKKIEETKGFNVWLTRNGLEIPTAVVRNANLVVISQCLSKDWKEVALKLNQNGSKVVILPTEGYPELLESRINFATGGENNYNHLVERLYCWNQEMFDYSLNYGNIDKEKLLVSGVPRFDLYNKKFKNFRLKINKQKKQQKTTILFSSNFPRADILDYEQSSSDYTFEKYKSEVKSFGYDMKDDFLENFVIQESKSRSLLVEFIKQVNEKYDFNILVKPHPSERLEYWINNFQGEDFKDINIAHNDYIYGSLEHSDIVIARSCSTLLESFLLDKCSVQLFLNPNDNLKNNDKENDGNYLVNSLDDFDKLIKAFNNNEWKTAKLLEERESILKARGINPSQNNSINIVAKDLIELCNFNKNNSKLFFLEKLKNYFKFYLLCSFDFLLHDLLIQKNKRKYLFNMKNYIDYLGRVDKHFHKADEKEILSCLK